MIITINNDIKVITILTIFFINILKLQFFLSNRKLKLIQLDKLLKNPQNYTQYITEINNKIYYI